MHSASDVLRCRAQGTQASEGSLGPECGDDTRPPRSNSASANSPPTFTASLCTLMPPKSSRPSLPPSLQSATNFSHFPIPVQSLIHLRLTLPTSTRWRCPILPSPAKLKPGNTPSSLHKPTLASAVCTGAVN